LFFTAKIITNKLLWYTEVCVWFYCNETFFTVPRRHSNVYLILSYTTVCTDFISWNLSEALLLDKVEKANIVKDPLKGGVHRKNLHDKKYITLLYFLECVEANYVKSFEKRRR
jgi:hypothetical protein